MPYEGNEKGTSMTNIPTFASLADVEAAAQRMRAFFQTGATLQVDYRREALVKLKAYLKANEARILEALHADLGKAARRFHLAERTNATGKV